MYFLIMCMICDLFYGWFMVFVFVVLILLFEKYFFLVVVSDLECS